MLKASSSLRTATSHSALVRRCALRPSIVSETMYERPSAGFLARRICPRRVITRR